MGGVGWYLEFREAGLGGTVSSVVRSNEVVVVVTTSAWSSVVKIDDRDAMLNVAYDWSPLESSLAGAVFPFPTRRLCSHLARTVGSSGIIDSYV